MARRKRDQYFRARTGRLVRETGKQVALGSGDLGGNGSTPHDGVTSDAEHSTAVLPNGAGEPGRPLPPSVSPVQSAPANGDSGGNGSTPHDGVVADGEKTLIFSLALLPSLSPVQPAPANGDSGGNGSTPHDGVVADGERSAAIPQDGAVVQLNGTEQPRLRAALSRPQTSAGGFVQAALLLAIAASLLWLAWLKPGHWRDGLIIAVAAGLAIRMIRPLERHIAALAHRALAPPVRYFTRRISVVNRMQRLWRRVPAGAGAAIGLLVLLNVLIALALLDTAKLSSGVWAIHTTIAFAVMCVLNVLLVKSSLFPSLHTSPASPRDYFVTLEPIKTDTTDHSIHSDLTLDSRHSDERAEGPEPARPKPSTTRSERPARFHRLHIPHVPGKIRTGVAAGAVILAAGWIGYAHPGPLLILAVLVVGATILSMTEVDRRQAVAMLLAVALGVASVDYISWRFSVANWQGWWIAVPLLCAELLGAIHVVGFQCTVWPWRRPVIEPTEDPTQHAIFILIPTLNEGVVTLRPTLEGCIAAHQKYLAQYPHGQVSIVVCNDGRVGKYPHWAEVETLAQELGVRCVTRSTGGGAKAGNIENARQEYGITGTALLAIFDADQVPEPDFLLKTISPFADPKVGWVQTGQYYANLNNPVSRWADDQQSMFYNLLCPGKAALNAAFICGTNVVIRAAALDEIGGLPQDSVTEDFAGSINLHSRWRSIYLTDILATGLGPLDIPSYLKQQGRWALGTLGVFRDYWRAILLPKKNGLRLGQRVQYLLACTHYLCGLRDLIYVITPILFIFTGVPAVRTATLNDYLLHFLPYAVLGIGGMWYATRGVTGLRGVIIGFGSSPALIGSLAAVILHRKKPFAVTSKEHQGRLSLRYLGIYVLCLLLCATALAWATQVKGRQQTSLFISLIWVIYSLLLLASFLWLAYKDIRTHAPRHLSAAEITTKQAYPSKLLTQKNALRPVLNLGLAALIASPLLLGTRLAALPIFTSAATPFVITQQQVDARYIGVSVPVQSLSSQPSMLEHDLGISFSIIGRTQDISDRFDTAWADKLAAHGARPWVVLQFGNFGANHKPPLTASLPAIFNGVDDSQIARWAAEIRDYGKPVYLTVLLQVDRNWSVSSAVADDGIPEDVPRAWMHIQSVFRAAGADNVAWVWAPADPLHDQRFAPPPSTIDAVLQDFIMYPGTQWGNPQQVLRGLAERYPGKPLFVEVSVSGQADEKAAWLARLGQAVDDSPQVYALLYHEGGPDLNPSPAEAKSWSEISDPKSLAAWRRIVTTLRTARPYGNLREAAGRRRASPGAGRPSLWPLAAYPSPGPAGGGVARDAAQHGLPG